MAKPVGPDRAAASPKRTHTQAQAGAAGCHPCPVQRLPRPESPSRARAPERAARVRHITVHGAAEGHHMPSGVRGANQALGRRRPPKAGSGKACSPTQHRRPAFPAQRCAGRARDTHQPRGGRRPLLGQAVSPSATRAAHAQGQRGRNVRIGTRSHGQWGRNVRIGTHSS